MNVPPEVAYVTACALGLAFSQHEGDEAVVDLLTAAEARPETLNAARTALTAYPSEDRAIVLAAGELLAAAERAARVRAGADV